MEPIGSETVAGVQEVQGIGSRDGSNTEIPEVRRKRRDATGIAFGVMLVMWLLVLGLKIREGRTNLWPIVFGCAFFEVMNKGLSALVAKRPNVLPGLQKKNVDSFLNTAVSLLHSTIISFAVIGLLVREWSRTGLGRMWTHEALTEKTWLGAYAVLGVSSGYFAYDQWDMLRRNLYKPKSPSLLTHHLLLLICFGVALLKDSCINYLILTLVCEVHSIFLHLRKVALLIGASRKWRRVIQLEWRLNWLTFFTARLMVHILITLKLFQDRKKFSAGVELPLASLGMLGLNVLNFVLGQGLYRAFLRERSGKGVNIKVDED